jgi:hypothetical protein
MDVRPESFPLLNKVPFFFTFDHNYKNHNPLEYGSLWLQVF